MNFLVCDLQFGSTGKGLIAYYLARQHKLRTAVAAYAPNAGHTAVDGGHKFVTSALPVAGAVDTVAEILVGPGAVYDPERVIHELGILGFNGQYREKPRLCIHPASVPLIPQDLEAEKGFRAIGSTMKGTAAANWRRMQRWVRTILKDRPETIEYFKKYCAEAGVEFSYDADDYNFMLGRALMNRELIVEGAQGFGLSIYHGMYPHVTSRDTTPNQIAADVGLPSNYSRDVKIIGCMRTFPIRVANRHDEKGELVGYSGPGYDDQEEITWSDLGMQPELTTVTKLPRRIFSYSKQQIEDAIAVVQPDHVFLNFCNYLGAGEQLSDIIEHVNSCRWGDSLVRYLGWGADVSQVREVF